MSLTDKLLKTVAYFFPSYLEVLVVKSNEYLK